MLSVSTEGGEGPGRIERVIDWLLGLSMWEAILVAGLALGAIGFLIAQANSVGVARQEVVTKVLSTGMRGARTAGSGKYRSRTGPTYYVVVDLGGGSKELSISAGTSSEIQQGDTIRLRYYEPRFFGETQVDSIEVLEKAGGR